MTETKATANRPRRADARRSVAAIIDAAIELLGERPDASLGDVADRAGVTRQTIYAHFGSRDALIGAVLDRVSEEIISAIDEAQLDDGPAAPALVRFLDTGWRAFERVPFIVHLPTSAEGDRRRHEPALDRLRHLIERGRAAGEFDAESPTSWLLTATLVLGHAAGDAVVSGELTGDEAIRALRSSVLRLVGAPSDPA